MPSAIDINIHSRMRPGCQVRCRARALRCLVSARVPPSGSLRLPAGRPTIGVGASTKPWHAGADGVAAPRHRREGDHALSALRRLYQRQRPLLRWLRHAPGPPWRGQHGGAGARRAPGPGRLPAGGKPARSAGADLPAQRAEHAAGQRSRLRDTDRRAGHRPLSRADRGAQGELRDPRPGQPAWPVGARAESGRGAAAREWRRLHPARGRGDHLHPAAHGARCRAERAHRHRRRCPGGALRLGPNGAEHRAGSGQRPDGRRAAGLTPARPPGARRERLHDPRSGQHERHLCGRGANSRRADPGDRRRDRDRAGTFHLPGHRAAAGRRRAAGADRRRGPGAAGWRQQGQGAAGARRADDPAARVRGPDRRQRRRQVHAAARPLRGRARPAGCGALQRPGLLPQPRAVWRDDRLRAAGRHPAPGAARGPRPALRGPPAPAGGHGGGRAGAADRRGAGRGADGKAAGHADQPALRRPAEAGEHRRRAAGRPGGAIPG